MADVNVKVKFDESKFQSAQQLTEKVESSGLKIRHHLDELQMVTGTIEDSKVDTLTKVDGIISVKPERIATTQSE